MKKLFLFFVAISLAQISFSQTVPLDSVAKYEGKKITVCSKVIGTHVSSGDKKNTYINFGKPYPDNTFTVMISGDDAAKFKYVPADFLQDKTVCITGTVTIFKGKPEIVVTSEDQIKIQK
jgi:DNA/RNA endonuclease YhcR with UshA esterase domain